jgi:hypothetical protein
MPLHDWTKVDAGAFHGFHGRWITFLTGTLKKGVLPKGYSADGEQITRASDPNDRIIGDVVALRPQERLFDPPPEADPGVAVADHPLRVRVRAKVPVVRPPRRHIVIRHKTGHRVVAIIEIVSPANKDRLAHVEEFAGKVATALTHGVHVMVLDLFPPGRHDPNGLHEAVVQQFEPELYSLPDQNGRTFASYAAGSGEVGIEHPAVGSPLPEMPLFLTPDRYVTIPLEPSYMAAWDFTPDFVQEVLDPPSGGHGPQE